MSEHDSETAVLREVRKWPQGEVAKAELLRQLHAEESLQVLADLIEHVRTMGIASRFRQDRYANQAMGREESALSHLDIGFGQGNLLSEIGHRRASLQMRLEQVRSTLVGFFGEIAALREEIELSNTEWDGSPVPRPSPEELEQQNLFTPPQ